MVQIAAQGINRNILRLLPSMDWLEQYDAWDLYRSSACFCLLRVCGSAEGAAASHVLSSLPAFFPQGRPIEKQMGLW